MGSRSKVHAGAIGHIVAAPVGTEFMREKKKINKSKWCFFCRGRGIKHSPWHKACTGFRNVLRVGRVPCECPCRKGLAILDPDL